ncbi:desulfoferrodoxin [candidate division KSB1 bacterium]|nr:desulfoferrodoxin [candidate division KSB1 bacterium]
MQRNSVFKCQVCGNMVEMVHVGGGTLVCCGQPMTLLNENTEDAATEKHVPVIEQDGDKVTVSVGSVLHPMEEKHFIQWIEVITTDKVYRRHLKPEDKPVVQFIIEGEVVKAREYCNLHGLWSA